MVKILSLLIIIGLLACKPPKAERIEKEGYNIAIIDSCEYIEVVHGLGTEYGYYSLTHKGNCKNHK